MASSAVSDETKNEIKEFLGKNEVLGGQKYKDASKYIYEAIESGVISEGNEVELKALLQMAVFYSRNRQLDALKNVLSIVEDEGEKYAMYFKGKK